MGRKGRKLSVVDERFKVFELDHEDRFEALREHLEIQDLLEDLHFEFVQRRGDEVWARCPYHDDRVPSWSINVAQDSDRWGLHSCLTCREDGTGKGNVVTLAKDILQLQNYKEALSWLEKYSGIETIDPESRLELSLRKRLRKPRKNKTTRKGKSPAQLYTGFSYVQPGTDAWRYLVKERKVTREQIKKHGIKVGRGRYGKRVVFPIKLHSAILNFYARHISGGEPKGLYHKGKDTISETLYGLEHADKLVDTCYLVEGVFDVLAVERALDAMGSSWGGNVFGTNGPMLHQAQARLLRHFKNVIVIPDMKGKAKSLAPSCKNLLTNAVLWIVEVPRGKDPDDVSLPRLVKLLKHPEMLRQKVIIVKVDYSLNH